MRNVLWLYYRNHVRDKISRTWAGDVAQLGKACQVCTKSWYGIKLGVLKHTSSLSIHKMETRMGAMELFGRPWLHGELEGSPDFIRPDL